MFTYNGLQHLDFYVLCNDPFYCISEHYKHRHQLHRHSRENVPVPTAQPRQKVSFCPRTIFPWLSNNIWNQLLTIINTQQFVKYFLQFEHFFVHNIVKIAAAKNVFTAKISSKRVCAHTCWGAYWLVSWDGNSLPFSSLLYKNTPF